MLDKFQYQIHIKNLKQPLNHGLVLKKVNLDKAAWLKPYIDMNTDLRKEPKNDFEKVFKLMNNKVLEKLWKMWENIDILNFSQQKEEEIIYYQR